MALFNDLNDFNPQDQELLNNLAQSGAMLYFDEVQAGINEPNPLDAVKKSGKLGDISREIIQNSPFGEESLFAVKDGHFSTEPMNINKLLYDIASYNKDNKRIDYNFLRYRIPFGTKDKKFETENVTYDVNVKLNTLEGIVDFGQNPFFRFKINVRTQKTSYELLYAFTKFKDSKDENKYAIILSLSKGTDFISVLTFLDKKLVEKSEKRILEEYEKAFKDAHNKSEVLDFLYETAPGFVLEKRDEKLLYSDLKLLADKRIDIFGTNENIAIINIINALKESKWFYDQINTGPTVVRKLFKKFSQRYIEDLIISFVNLGLSIWNEEDLQDAISYRIESERLDFEDNNSHLRLAYWTIYLDSKKEYKIGYTAHIFDNYDISARESKVVDLATVKPFAPLEISLGEDNTLFIPTFVGEYFTDQQIAEDRSIILNNIAAGILPELTLARIRPLLKIKIPQIKALKLNPSWLPKRIITTKPNETVTLIGNYMKDTRRMLSELNYPKNTNFGAKQGDFNLLNVPEKDIKSFSTFWEDFNQPWLKQATDRGDDVVIMSDKFDQKLLYKSTGEITGFGKEIQFMDNLVKKGVYRFIREEGKYIKIK